MTLSQWLLHYSKHPLSAAWFQKTLDLRRHEKFLVLRKAEGWGGFQFGVNLQWTWDCLATQSEPWGSVFKQSSPQTSGSPIVSSLNPTPFWNEPFVFNRKQANRKHTLIIPPKMEDKVQYSALSVSVMFKCIFCNRNILQCFLSLIILWNSAALEVSWSNYIL